MKRFFSILLLSIILVACDTERKEQGTSYPKDAVSISEAKFHPVGGIVVFSITSDKSWRIDYSNSLPNTIKVSPTSGSKGTSKVEIIAQMAEEDINTNLRVNTIHGVNLGTVNVLQEKPRLNVQLEVNGQNQSPDDNVMLSWEHDNQVNITIDSNTDWEIKPSSGYFTDGVDGTKIMNSWLQFSKTSGLVSDEEKTVRLQPLSPNIDATDNRGSFRLFGPGKKEYLFSIEQGHVKLMTNVPKGNSLSFAPCNPDPFILEIDSEFDRWELSAPDWILTDVTSGNSKDVDSLEVSSKANHEKRALNENVRITGYLLEDNIEKTAVREIPVELRPYVLEVDNANIEFGPMDEGSRTITLSSSGKWVLNNIPSWVDEISPMNGIGMEYKNNKTQPDDISIKLKPNYDMVDERIDDFLIRSDEGNDLSCPVTITQRKYMFGITASDLSIGTYDTTEKNLTITSSGEWELSSDKSWLIIKTLSGSKDSTVKYSATSNETGYDRTATITLASLTHEKAKIGYDKKTITITQPKLTWEVSPASGIKYSFDAIDTKTEIVSINSSVDWSVDKPDWIQTNPSNGKPGETGLEIKVDHNYDLKSRRDDYLKIKSKQGNKSHTIYVEQSPFIFDTADEDVKFDALNPNSKEVKIGECLGSWTVVNSSDWLTVSPTSGSGSATLTFTPTEYVSDSASARDRDAVVLVRSAYYSKNNELVKQIKVTQKVHIFAVSNTAVSFEADEREKIVNVTCSGSWTASCDKDWLEVSPKNATGNEALTISVEKNSSKSERTATVTVKSGSFQKHIQVTQAVAK